MHLVYTTSILKSIVFDNEEKRTQISVLASGKESKYIISDKDAKLITGDNMYIEFSTVMFGNEDIKISGTPMSIEAVFQHDTDLQVRAVPA